MATEQQNIKPMTTRTGWVSRVTGKDTINVELRTLVKHGMYGKYLRRRTGLLVHDPGNQAQAGDEVEITECRPISKSKSWRLVRVVRRAEL